MKQPHSLLRLTQKILSTPHLIEASAFENVVEFLDVRNEDGIKLYINNNTTGSERELIYNSDTKVGVIKLTGPLTYLHYQPMCAETPTSYELLKSEMESLVDQGAKTVVFDTDSPGGEAYGVFETARYIRKLADDNGVKLITYVDGIAASAAYALASVSDEIIANPSAEVGSIGVVVRLRNANKAMKNMGVEDTYVFAGESKIPFDSEGNFADSFLSDLQDKVDTLYGEFTSHVATMRGISQEDVKSTNAKMFLANKSISLGLVDKVMEVEEFYSYLSDIAIGEKNTTMLGKNFMNKDKEKFSMNEFEQLQAEFSAYKTESATQVASLQEVISAKEAELSELSAKLSAFEEAQALAAEEAKLAELAAKKEARKEKLSVVTSEQEAETLLASLEALDDTAFETVVNSLAAKAQAVESSTLFTEMGVSDNGDENKLSDTAQVLKAKYKKV